MAKVAIHLYIHVGGFRCKILPELLLSHLRALLRIFEAAVLYDIYAALLMLLLMCLAHDFGNYRDADDAHEPIFCTPVAAYKL
jgi:hypothetical protein